MLILTEIYKNANYKDKLLTIEKNSSKTVEKKIIHMNKKQLIDAIKICPYLNNSQKDVLMYFILFSSENEDLSATSISTTVLHIARFTRINTKYAYKVINKLKQRNLIIESKGEGYQNSTYQINNEELKKIIEFDKGQQLYKNSRKIVEK